MTMPLFAPTPACFFNRPQFVEWLKLARESREKCSICDDCLAPFAKDMAAQGRCQQDKWATLFVMPGKHGGNYRGMQRG